MHFKSQFGRSILGPAGPVGLALVCSSWLLSACGDDGTTDTGAASSTGGGSTTGEATDTSGGPPPTSADSTGSSGGESSSGTPATDSGSSSGSGSDTTGGSESSSGGAAGIEFSAQFFTLSVAPVLDGEFCSADGCVTVMASTAALEVPANSEVEVWLDAPGHLLGYWQFASADQDMSEQLLVLTDMEAAGVAMAFGVTLMPGMSHLVLEFSAQGISPTIDDPAADGPHYVTPLGAPDPVATATGPGGGRVIFFNVAPGDWTVSVPGCDEGSDYWGAASDNEIDVSLTADSLLSLLSNDCMP